MGQEHSWADLNGMVKGVEGLIKIQKELGDTFQEANRYWLVRAKSETDCVSDLVAKLPSARSIPDATSVYQEWMGHRMQRLCEDSQKFVADCQKLTSDWTNAISNGALKGNT